MATISTDNQPLVSICCITFNHAPYIRAALEGFLKQETDFAFEILVHDDASTDGTVEILREYEKAHPCIRVFYEEVNQHGQGTYRGGYIYGLLIPNAQGRYIALCEGDDYWIDSSKLQKQFDYLELHPECYETIHAAIVLDGQTGEEIGFKGLGSKPKNLSASEMMMMMTMRIPTASRMTRMEGLSEYSEKWSFDRPVGDIPSLLFSATKGYIHYDPHAMCVYRYKAPGSWSYRMQSEEARAIHATRLIKMYESINNITGKEWQGELAQRATAPVKKLLIMGERQIFKDSELARKAYAKITIAEHLKCIIQRFLWLLGFTIAPKGYDSSGRWKIVKRN